MVHLSFHTLLAFLGAFVAAGASSNADQPTNSPVIPEAHQPGTVEVVSIPSPNPTTTSGSESYGDAEHPTSYSRCHRQWPCNCSKNSTEIAAIDAERAKHNCASCNCGHGPNSGADGMSVTGRLAAVGAAAVVGVVGVAVFL